MSPGCRGPAGCGTPRRCRWSSGVLPGRLAVAAMQALIVSNHGGRQLDAARRPRRAARRRGRRQRPVLGAPRRRSALRRRRGDRAGARRHRRRHRPPGDLGSWPRRASTAREGPGGAAGDRACATPCAARKSLRDGRRGMIEKAAARSARATASRATATSTAARSAAVVSSRVLEPLAARRVRAIRHRTGCPRRWSRSRIQAFAEN